MQKLELSLKSKEEKIVRILKQSSVFQTTAEDLKKDIERLRNGEEYGSGEENWHIDTYAKEIKFYFSFEYSSKCIFYRIIFFL